MTTSSSVLLLQQRHYQSSKRRFSTMLSAEMSDNEDIENRRRVPPILDSTILDDDCDSFFLEDDPYVDETMASTTWPPSNELPPSSPVTKSSNQVPNTNMFADITAPVESPASPVQEKPKFTSFELDDDDDDEYGDYAKELPSDFKLDVDHTDDDDSTNAPPLATTANQKTPPKINTPNTPRTMPDPPPIYNNGPPTLNELQPQLDRLTNDVYQQNQGQSFNINSPKQVAQALYGEVGRSTRKDELEIMASAGNRLADLILQYRHVKNQIKKLEKQKELQATGRQVQSVTSVTKAPASTNSASSTKNSLVDSATHAAKRNQEVATDPLLLVDASALIFRAYHSHPPMHRSSDGMPTGAVMGFCSMLNRLLLDSSDNNNKDPAQAASYTPPRMVMVFDSKEIKTFRHEIYPEYKANRGPVPIDLAPQFDLIRQAVHSYGIVQIEAPGYEADDVIATLVANASSVQLDTNILSGDKDLMQLVTDNDQGCCVHMIDPVKMARTTQQEVVEKWNVGPSDLRDVLALAGDAADNIPGVPGIGPKIAAELINRFGSLDNLFDNLGEITQKKRREKLEENVEKALLSRRLVTLERNVPLEKLVIRLPEATEEQELPLTSLEITQYADLLDLFRAQPMDSSRILEFYDRMQFRELKRRFQNSMDKANEKAKRRKSQRRPKAHVPEPEDYIDVPF